MTAQFHHSPQVCQNGIYEISDNFSDKILGRNRRILALCKHGFKAICFVVTQRNLRLRCEDCVVLENIL
jgi:hypothetical protein